MKYLKNSSTLILDREKCSGCKRCTEVCPQGVFVFENKKSNIQNKDLCMECGACALNCEDGALTVQKGVGCAAALIGALKSGGEPVCGCSDTEASGSGCC